MLTLHETQNLPAMSTAPTRTGRRPASAAPQATSSTEDVRKTDSVAAVGKAFAILEAIGQGGQIGISDLATKLDMSKTTVHRFLQTLRALGYVEQEGDTERYGLTIALFQLGALALENVDLVREADKEMRPIAQQTRETVHLGAFDDDSIIYIHKIDADYGLRMQSRIGRRNPLYSTAIGKVLLAWRDPAEARDILARVEFKKSTPKTLGSAEAVLSILPRVREQGFGEDDEEQEEGLRCLAVPIFDGLGHVTAAVSLSFPSIRCAPDTRTHYIALLKQAGAAISEKLGYRSEISPR